MTTESEENDHKFSKNEIEALIQKAEALQQVSQQPIVSKQEIKDIPLSSSPWISRFAIPLALVAFITSAYYLSSSSKPEIVPNLTKESVLLQKKRTLFKNANLSFFQVEGSINELAGARKERLRQAREQLDHLLKENEEGPLSDFSLLFNLATSTYLAVEEKENALLSSTLEKFFDEATPQKREEIELFDVLVCEAKLQPYLSTSLIKKLKLPLQLPKFELRALHEKFWNSLQ